MEDMFDIGEILYQKFLLDIYRHCDKMELPSISADEKEKMAMEMVDFVGHVVASLEKKRPLIKIARKDSRAMKNISRIIRDRVRNDEFSKSVLRYYVSSKKLSQRDLGSYLTTAAIAVLSKGKRADIKDIEAKIRKAKPYLFRVASLLSPAVSLHEKLFSRVPEDRESEEISSHHSFDSSFARYIG